MYYVGMSKTQVNRRWKPSQYRTMSLHPYIQKYGWGNIEHLVVKDGLTEEQALYWEDRLLCMYSQMGCCINNNRSGYIFKSNIKEYYRQRDKQPEWKVYSRVKAYNRYHPDKATETPLEAKKKYLGYGYIPDYIKSDDLA